MTTENTSNEMSESELSVIQGANRYYQEVTITGVTGECPYGHKEGEQFKITSMNSDGICGALLKSIFFQIVTLHYGGSLLWDKNPDVSRGCCPEGGKVQVEINRVAQKEKSLLKTPYQMKGMTGKGYPAIDNYRIFIEVYDIAVNCYWGHKIGDVFEVDTFNIGGACCFLYTQLYPYIHVLMSGSSPPWAWDEHTIIGECPDTYDRLAYRLFVEERK
jgi:uncharacterized repeat protein (TIGR04076 family)